MYDDKEIAYLTAKMLIEIDAVAFRPDDPFTLTSGRQSPVYIDCRKLISFPRIRNQLMDFMVAKIYRHIGCELFDGIAGGETAGIPFAAMLAEKLMLPMQYVRKKPKGFGRNAQIEGHLNEGDQILLVEDLASDAGSKKLFCDALRQAGAHCDHAIVIFYYDIFDHAPKLLDEMGLRLHYLASWWDILQVMKDKQYHDNATIAKVEAFLHSPNDWQG